MNTCANYRATRKLHRREILRAGGLGLLGLSLGDLLAGKQLAAEPVSQSAFGKAKACILLFMWGGPAQQDTWDMKPQAPAEFRGEFNPIATNVPGIQICEHLPLLSQRTDRLVIVRTMTHGNADHLTATHFLLTGEAPPAANTQRAEFPHMGSVLAKLNSQQGVLPPFVSMRPQLENTVPRFVEQSRGQSAGWLGPVYDPFTIDANPAEANYKVGEFTRLPELSIDRLEDRRGLLRKLDQQLRMQDASLAANDANRRRAFDLLSSAVGAGGAFRLDEEPRKIRERYGLNPHGQSVLQARRLVERGVKLVTVYWPNDGIKNVSVYWDTHSRNFIDLKERLMPVADRAFAALIDDLEERGMLDETLVLWTGEFGRTPRVGQVNSDAGAGRDGRDHWPGCFTSVLAGGGIRGGMVYGQSDKVAAFPHRDPVKPSELTATVYHALGVPSKQILYDMQNRPHFISASPPLAKMLG
jgi:hypothetical protein